MIYTVSGPFLQQQQYIITTTTTITRSTPNPMASHTHQGSPANVGPAVVLSLVEVVDDDESGGGITFEPVVKSEDVGGGEDGGFV